jgi:hypothetical protein
MIETRIIEGSCQAIDNTGHPLTEEQRLGSIQQLIED